MRQIATLVLAVLLVAGTVPAVGVAGAAQHDAEVQYVTNVDGDYGAASAGSTVAAENESNATVTGYELGGRSIAEGETLGLRIAGEGEGSTPIVLTVDGERHDLGILEVDGERGSFQVADDLPDDEALDVEIHCEFGYDSDDGWYLRCEITFESIAAGVHDVGINDLAPTRVEVEPADGADDNVTVTGYEVGDRVVHPDEPLELTVSGTADGPGSTPVVLTLDGERHEIGTVESDGERVSFQAADDRPDGEATDIEIECEFGYDSDGNWYIRCEIRIGSAAAAVHDVGVNDMEATTVSVGEELELTDYEFAGTVASPNDTDASVRVFRNNTATIQVRGEGVGETPLALTVDGERHRLGTVSLTADGADFDRDPAIAWPDVEIHCEGGYDSEDGWWIECEIDISFASVSQGGHDVGVNDLEPTRVDVEPAEARMASFTVENNTIRSGDTLRVRTSFEGASGAVPVEVTVDGETRRVGTVHVEDGAVQRVETADGEAGLVNFVPCPDLQDDDPWIVIWCAQDVPAAAQGTHEVAVNDMEPTTVTVEGGPSGGVLGGVVDFLDDVLRGIGDLLDL